MKIAFISIGDPLDKKIWSGTTNRVYTMLSEKHELEVINVYKRSFLEFLTKVFVYLSRHILKKNYDRSHNLIIARNYSNQVLKKLKKTKDINLIFLTGNSQCITYLKTEIPIIYLTDATFAAMLNYYPSFTKLLNVNKKEGNIIEKKALSKSEKIIFASDWAKNSAINDYSINSSKCITIPFGANLSKVPEIRNIDFKRKGNEINLLFLGVDWERKGGDIAIATVKELRKRKIKANLTIVGCYPPYEIKESYIKLEGFLNKNIEKEEKKLTEIISNSDILILPTKAECAGIAFSEACAYGLPSITFDTGGISNYVINGYNGYRIDLKLGYQKFADLIEDILVDKEKLNLFRKNSRKLYEEKLNWQTWLLEVEKIINSL